MLIKYHDQTGAMEGVIEGVMEGDMEGDMVNYPMLFLSLST